LAFLLAGGKSRRFGSDKARVSVGGKPLVVRLADDLNRLGWQVAIVAQTTEDYHDLGVPVITDLYRDSGPMAGIIAALSDCQSRGSESCLIANCDLVPSKEHWPKNWAWLDAMETLWSSDSSLIVVFESIDFMPLPGLYASNLFDRATQLWDEGKRSLRDLHRDVQRSSHGTILSLSWPQKEMPQTFNTPEELRSIVTDDLDSESIS
jgi:molybdopterin-guanine dinucleotide biosynthesis protein A